MADAFIDVFADLHKQRERYVQQRDDALKLANESPDNDYGKAMANLCKALSLAISSIDQAIRAG